MEKKKTIKGKKTKKKSKVWIICLAVLVVIGAGLTTLGIYKYKENEAERKRILEEQRIALEKHQALVSQTKEYFEFYLNNEPKEDIESGFEVFNQVILENEKNKKLDYDNFLKTSMKGFNPSNSSKTLKNIEKEIENYGVEKLNLEISLDNVDGEKYDKDTVNEIFNSHEFIKNKDQELEKRTNYLKSLEGLKSDITGIQNQSKLFYKSGNKYLAKNDDVVKTLKSFSDKYKLNLVVEKEFLVPILCYHGVLDNPWGISSLFVRVSEFESQMKYLSEAGYTPLFVSEIKNAKNYEKPIIITFDDGYRDVYTNAFPILKKYNMKANVYMISDWIGGDTYMTNDMTIEMSNSPLIEIGSHTVDHKALASLSSENIEYELKTSKEHLEALIGKSVNVIAYPTGSYDSRVVSTARKYYTYGLSTNKGKENPDRLNTYTLNRIYVYRGTGLSAFKNLF